MLHIGCHLSSSKGYRHMGEDALSIKADTFQFFTRNPRGSKAKKADPKDAEALRGVIAQTGYELKDIQTETVEKKPFRLFHKG